MSNNAYNIIIATLIGIAVTLFVALLAAKAFIMIERDTVERQKVAYELTNFCEDLGQINKVFDEMITTVNNNRVPVAKQYGVTLKEFGVFELDLIRSEEIERSGGTVLCKSLVKVANTTLYPNYEAFIPFELAFSYGYLDRPEREYIWHVSAENLNDTAYELMIIFDHLANL